MTAAAPRTLLVIDDDGDLDALISAELRARGHHVVNVADVGAATATLRAATVDLVIVDVSTSDSVTFLHDKALDPRLVAIPTLLVTSDPIETTAIRHVLDLLGSRSGRDPS